MSPEHTRDGIARDERDGTMRYPVRGSETARGIYRRGLRNARECRLASGAFPRLFTGTGTHGGQLLDAIGVLGVVCVCLGIGFFVGFFRWCDRFLCSLFVVIRYGRFVMWLIRPCPVAVNMMIE